MAAQETSVTALVSNIMKSPKQMTSEEKEFYREQFNDAYDETQREQWFGEGWLEIKFDEFLNSLHEEWMEEQKA